MTLDFVCSAFFQS